MPATNIFATSARDRDDYLDEREVSDDDEDSDGPPAPTISGDVPEDLPSIPVTIISRHGKECAYTSATARAKDIQEAAAGFPQSGGLAKSTLVHRAPSCTEPLCHQTRSRRWNQFSCMQRRTMGSLTILGKTFVIIKGPGGTACGLDVLVSDQTKLSCLLGLDAICALGIVIDGKKREVRCDNWSTPLPVYRTEKRVVTAHTRAVESLTEDGRWRVCHDITLPPGQRCSVLVQAPTKLAVGEQVQLLLEPRRKRGRVAPLHTKVKFCNGLFTRRFIGYRELPAAVGARSDVVATVVQPTNGDAPVAVALVEVVNVAPFAVTLEGGQVAFYSSREPVERKACARTTASINHIAVGDEDLDDQARGQWSAEDRRASSKTGDVSFELSSKSELARMVEQIANDSMTRHDDKVQLTREQAQQLKGVLDRQVVPMGFDPKDPAVRAANVEPVEIRIKPGAQPVTAPRRVTTPEGEQFKCETEEGFIRMGLVQKSFSDYASPVHLARKKNGGFRYCIDMRAVNRQVEAYAYPIPTCAELIDKLQGARWFTTLDARSGYWQFPLAEGSRKYTAFRSVAHGLLEWCRLPMGLVISSAEYQRRIETVLQGLTEECCLCYVDDVVVFSQSFEQHIKDLEAVLARFREANITINLEKSFFCRTNVAYLGFRISGEGIAPDHHVTDKISKTEGPLDYEQARSFLGLTVFYRRFIYDYAHLCRPIREQIKAATSAKGNEIKGVFKWTDECQHALVQLKETLTTYPVYRLPDPSRPYTLFTDASNYAIGCVLCQQDDDGNLYVVMYDSVALLPTQRHWQTTEREAYAVVHYVHKLAHYLDNGQDFTVFTDHEALQTALKGVKGKLLRWGLSLSPYVNRLHVRHMEGKKMPADFLSRPPGIEDDTYASRDPDQLRDPDVRAKLGQATCLRLVPVEDISAEERAEAFGVFATDFGSYEEKHGANWRVEATAQLQEDCEEIGPLYRAIRAGMTGKDVEGAVPAAVRQSKFAIDDLGVLNRVNENGESELVVPFGLRTFIMHEYHDGLLGGHINGESVLAKMKGSWWWPNMHEEVIEWCRVCEKCQETHRARGKRGLFSSLRAMEPFSITAMDVIGPLPQTHGGNKYILVWMDYLTRWAEAVPVPDAKAETIARAYFNNVIARWGAPLKLLTDRAQYFMGNVMTELAKLMGTTQLFTTPYHPQADGMVERFNGTLIRALSRYVSYSQREWDAHLPHIMFAYRSTPHSATKISPFEAMTGVTPRYPAEAALQQKYRRGTVEELAQMSGAAKKMVRLNDDISSALRLRRANKGRSPHTYKPGDWVQVSADGLAQIKRGKRDNKERERRAKLAHQWSTPLQVRAVKGNRLELVRKRRKYVAEAQHVEPWLKPVVTRKYVQDPFDLDNEDTSNAAAVRFITGHRDDDQGERQYQVQWEHDEDARRRGWLRRDEFNDLELVREYEETLALDAATSGQSRVDTLPPRHDPFDRARERRFARRGGSSTGDHWLRELAPRAPMPLWDPQTGSGRG